MSKNRKIECQKNCSGCGACKWICPKASITMQYDEEGFLYPVVNLETCISCGKCVDICSLSENKPQKNRSTYMGWNKDEEIKQKSSSGGIFFEIAKHILSKNGVVYGASFDDEWMVFHKRAENIEEIYPMLGSKYVQSDMQHIYGQIETDINAGRYVLFSGTPCQVNKVKRLFPSNLLFCTSVICHGVPSVTVWKGYLDYLRKLHNEIDIRKVFFRDKYLSWNKFSLRIEFENRIYIKEYDKDLYMKGFLENLFLRPSCYDCKEKTNNAADIIMGDFWGIEEHLQELDTRSGVSGIIICTEKGKILWDEIKNQLEYSEVAYSNLVKKNEHLEKSALQNCNREKFFTEMKQNVPIELAIENNLNGFRKTDTIGFHLFDKWMYCIRAGKSMEKFFMDNDYSNIAIYGMGVIGRQVLAELKSSSVTVAYGIDRSAENISVYGLPIVTLDGWKNMKKVDAIVVTPIQFFCEIEEMLWLNGYEGDVISIEHIIYYMERN